MDDGIFDENLKVGDWVRTRDGLGQIYSIYPEGNKWPYTVVLHGGKHELYAARELTPANKPVDLDAAKVLSEMIDEMEERLRALKKARDVLDGTL